MLCRAGWGLFGDDGWPSETLKRVRAHPEVEHWAHSLGHKGTHRYAVFLWRALWRAS